MSNEEVKTIAAAIQKLPYAQMLELASSLSAVVRRHSAKSPAEATMAKALLEWAASTLSAVGEPTEDAKGDVSLTEAIDTLDELSVRTRNLLQAENITTIADLIAKRRWAVIGIPGMGKKSQQEVDAAMKRLNLEFLG